MRAALLQATSTGWTDILGWLKDSTLLVAVVAGAFKIGSMSKTMTEIEGADARDPGWRGRTDKAIEVLESETAKLRMRLHDLENEELGRRLTDKRNR